MKIEFNTNDDLPLNELSKLHMLKLVVRPVFEEDGTFYHKFIQMSVCMSYENDTVRKH